MRRQVALAFLLSGMCMAQHVGCAPIPTPPLIDFGTIANRPAAGTCGRMFIVVTATTSRLTYDDGTQWNDVSYGWGYMANLPSAYTPSIHGAALHDSTVEATANKGVANGYAGLDAQGKVSSAAIPVINVTATQMPAFTGDITTNAGATATTLKNTGAAGTYQQVTTDAQGRVTAGATRTINTTSPLGGGGALSSDLTLTCATCVTSLATVPTKIANGTATFATTAIASLACSATVTVAAASVTTADVIGWSYATPPSATTDGRLTINPWPTAGNVNFCRMNPTAASITPTAIVINWKVIR